MVPKRALWLALLCSFSVYFIPIVGPHATFVIWESLGQRFSQFSKYPAWALTEFGVTLLLQAAAFGLFYWFWRRRRALRLIVLLVCGVAAVIEVQRLFFARIPARFMIEQETAQEKAGAWPEACRVTDGQVMAVRTPGPHACRRMDRSLAAGLTRRLVHPAHARLPADRRAAASAHRASRRWRGLHDQRDPGGPGRPGAGAAT